MKVEITSPDPKVQKAVMAHLVKVLEDKPRGLNVTEVNEKMGSFEIPQGPAFIFGKWQ